MWSIRRILFGDGGLKRFDAGLGVGVALELGQIIVGLDGQFGLVDVQKLVILKI